MPWFLDHHFRAASCPRSMLNLTKITHENAHVLICGLPLSSGLIPVTRALVWSSWWGVGSLGSRVRPCFKQTSKEDELGKRWTVGYLQPSEHSCIWFGYYILIPTRALWHPHVNILGVGLSCLPQGCFPKVMLRERSSWFRNGFVHQQDGPTEEELCFSDSEFSNCINNKPMRKIIKCSARHMV